MFIIIVGLSKFNPENLEPFIPPQEVDSKGQVVFGWPGILLGASASFYGYIGYGKVTMNQIDILAKDILLMPSSTFQI